MHSHWHNLIVKEWHAHKWKLASLATILLVVHTWILVDATLAGFDTMSDSQQAFNLFTLTTFFCIIPGALFVGMGVAAGERSTGTFAFMRALPVAPWKVAAAKLLMAAVTVVAPVALAVLLDELWFALVALAGKLPTTGMRLNEVSGFGPFALIGLAGLVASGLAVSILLWSAVAGARQSSELRAGIAAVGIFVSWGVATYLFALFAEGFFWDNDGVWRLFLAVWYIGPAGLTALLNRDPGFSLWPVAILLQLISLCGLCAWFLYRYAHADIDVVGASSRTSRRRGGRPTSLNPPRRSQLTAIGWKQWHESLPICIGGLLLVCPIIGVFLLAPLLAPYPADVNVYSMATAAVFPGVVVAMVVGIGTFVAELQPDLLTFWRSRPISPSLWFWTKYVTGALAILLLLDGPVGVAVYLGACFAAGGWIDVLNPGPIGYFGYVALWHLLAFSIAMCLTCVVRKAVYAGILAVGVLLVVLLTPELVQSLEWLDPIRAMDVVLAGKTLADLAHMYLPFFGVMLGLSAAASLLAWQAVVRDVSLRP